MLEARGSPSAAARTMACRPTRVIRSGATSPAAMRGSSPSTSWPTAASGGPAMTARSNTATSSTVTGSLCSTCRRTSPDRSCVRSRSLPRIPALSIREPWTCPGRARVRAVVGSRPRIPGGGVRDVVALAVAHDDPRRVYVADGRGQIFLVELSTVTSVVFALPSPASGPITAISDMAVSPRNSRRLYVVAGEHHASDLRKPRSRLFRYDVAADSWSDLTAALPAFAMRGRRRRIGHRERHPRDRDRSRSRRTDPGARARVHRMRLRGVPVARRRHHLARLS